MEQEIAVFNQQVCESPVSRGSACKRPESPIRLARRFNMCKYHELCTRKKGACCKQGLQKSIISTVECSREQVRFDVMGLIRLQPDPWYIAHMNMTKALAELDVLRGFIDFVNRQVGVYCDCLSSFYGNKVRVARQVARVTRPASRHIKNGQTVITWARLEDPTRPDVIHHRIIRTDEFIATNSEAGFNEQQVCWSIIFAYWDEEIRPQIAKIRGVEPNEVQVDALGDLRIHRKSIIHNGGILTATEYAKLKVINGICREGVKIAPTHDEMHKIFVAIKSAIGRLILEYTVHLPDAPRAEELVGIAIQSSNRA